MTLDLDPIRARLAAATPGPWERMPAEVSDTRPADCYDVWGGDDWLCASVHHTNADLIAYAPADMAALVAEVERLRTELADHTPAPCDMKCGEPYDFAWCETHDTTFPLGEKCKFDGREPWEVYADEADEQRRRAVRAEMQVERLRETMQRVREMHSPAKWYDDFCDDPECDREHVEISLYELYHSDTHKPACEMCSGGDLSETNEPTPWPCPTIRALDGAE